MSHSPWSARSCWAYFRASRTLPEFSSAWRFGLIQPPGVFIRCDVAEPQKIRTARSDHTADHKILAHQPGIVGIGIFALRALAHRVAVAPAATKHATLVL